MSNAHSLMGPPTGKRMAEMQCGIHANQVCQRSPSTRRQRGGLPWEA